MIEQTALSMNMGFIINEKVIRQKEELIMKSDHSVHQKTTKTIHTRILGLTFKKIRVTYIEPHYKME